MPQRILIVDDDSSRLKALETALRAEGYSEIRSTNDARRALPLFRDYKPDLLLVDLNTQRLDGITIIQQILSRVPQREFLPILVTTANVSAAMRSKALETGARDFLPSGYDAAELRIRVRNMLRERELHLLLEERVRARTEQLEQAEVEVAKRLAFAAEVRDYPDGSHPTRVGRMSEAIARELGLGGEEVELIGLAAPLHDIGKLALPDAILTKPGALTPAEWEIVRSHTTQGARMLTGTASRILQAAEEIALYHHENWNGTGYTPGLAGREIPIAGRIVTIADVFDALLHKRSYKEAWSVPDAGAFNESQRANKFDPEVLDAIHRMIKAEVDDPAPDVWEDFMTSVSETFTQTFARAMGDA
jgi:putative two-component system response regulator